MKRLIVVLTMLMITITVAYAYCNSYLSAASATYTAGGNITGRIGPAGNGGAFSKGDRLITDISHNGTNIDWLLLNNSLLWRNNESGHYSVPAEVANTSNGMYAISFDSIMNIKFRDSFKSNIYENAILSTSNLPPIYKAINTAIDADSVQKRYLVVHTLDMSMDRYDKDYVNKDLATMSLTDPLVIKYVFPQSYIEFDDEIYNFVGRYGHLENQDRVYKNQTPYISGNGNVVGSDGSNGRYVDGNGAFSPLANSGTVNSWISEFPLRIAILFNLSDVVFAVSDPSGSSTSQLMQVSNIDKEKLSCTGGCNYTSLYDKAALYQPMKIRLLDNVNLNVDFDALTDLNGTATSSDINSITKGKKLKLFWSNKLSYTGDDYVSVLIEKQNTSGSYDFVYYKNISKDPNGSFEIDTSNFEVGSYRISLVDETISAGNAAAYSSQLKSKNINVVEYQPHTVSFTKKTGLEYGKNVNAGDSIGDLKLSDTVTTVFPITYTLDANGDNSYQNFEIDGLDSNQASGAKSLAVKIKANAPDLTSEGLKAGVYKFCVVTQDADGMPASPVTNKTKICTSVSIDKTNLTAAFDDPNQTKKSIADASTVWNETATANPNTGAKVTYSVSGGDVSLITIDPDTGAIAYQGNNAFGKVKIKATADDDPSTGNDNYNPSFVEKEIVIYREVDGSVTPHTNSSSTTAPTFTSSDSNVKVNGIIGTIKGTLGTPDTIGGSTTTYRYGIKPGVGDANFFSVDSNTGVIKTTATSLGVKSYSITVTVSDNWSTKEIPITINVGVAAAENLRFYETSAAVNMITTKSVKATDTGVSVFATVKGSSNTNPVTYKIKDGSTNVIEVNPNSGAITIHGVGSVIIVAEKQGASGQANASTELSFTVTAGSQNFIYTDNAGNELPKSGSNYSAKTDTYAANKTIQLYTAGNPTGSSVTYQLKAGSPTDVISVDASGLVTILNASLNNQMGRVIIQATSHDPSGNYSDKTIELPINIEKGTRVISFKEKPIYVTNGKGKVTPVTEVDGVVDTDGDVLIEVDSNEDHTIAWTNDNKTVNYNYSGETGKDIKIHATKPMNRNYKAAEAEGTLHIMGPDENILAITSPGQIIYGDHFTIRSSQYDADSTNVQYTFEVDKTTYISSPTVSGNSAEFDAKQFSGSNKTTITVKRTADGETPLSKQVQVTVLPKPIEIIIDDKEKLKGEQNPTLTYQDFTNDLVSWNGVQDVIQENDIKLSTTAKTDSNAGAYPIKGDSNTLNRTYPNYSFSFKEGTLTIKEEAVEDDWYHLELDDGSNTLYTGGWTNKDVNIISDHNEYINMSLDQSTWKPSQVTVAKEGETNQSFWMKKDSGAVTKEKQEIIKIDKTAPKVKNIKAKDSNNKLQDIINKLSGGIFFKPGTSFEITTDDTKDDLKVSGTKEMAYKVYKTEKQSRAGDELIKEGDLTVTNEKASITISELSGTYRVCVTPTDNAGNTNTESCHEVELKKIDVDVDGDGKPDFNDPDGDGCPDLNIKWKDPNDETKWIVINGDRDYDGLPDLNIDSDGNGIPDLNIDTDGDGKPDLNLVILKKGDWKPTKCVKADIDNGILEEYCTGTSAKAIINVDTDNDGIPNINIDNKGDFKPHINISKDGKTSIINIAIIHEWKPELNKALNSFQFDTMAIDEKKNVLLNIDTDGDGRPDVNIDLDGDGKPDVNVDTDFDWIPNINIDSDGDGQPDTNIDTDNDGIADENIVEIKEWKPNKNVDGDLPYDTMDFNEQDPSDDTTTDPIPPKNDTSVKGVYNPATSIGGASTGDETNVLIHLGFMGLGIIAMIYLYYRYQKNTFQ